MAPRLTPLSLADTDRERLERGAPARDNRRPRVLRARIVLCCHAGCSNRESARRLKLTPHTVGKWRARFLAHGVRGLADQPRSGAPRTISDALVEAVLAKTLHERAPAGARRSEERRVGKEWTGRGERD